MKQNESYLAEKYYDQQYENQAREESITECPHCEGLGSYSDCCGAIIGVNNICTDCMEYCEEDICPKCDGDGVISI